MDWQCQTPANLNFCANYGPAKSTKSLGAAEKNEQKS